MSSRHATAARSSRVGIVILFAVLTALLAGCSEVEEEGLTDVGMKLSAGSDIAPIALPALSKRGSSKANDINALDVVVGCAVDGSGVYRPVRWTQSGTSWSVTKLPGQSACADGINDSGVIVGRRWSSGQQEVVAWVNDALVVVGPGQAWDISSSGTIVGSTPGFRPAAWRRIAAKAWETAQILPGSAATSQNGEAWGINDSEVVVGFLNDNGRNEWAVTWSYDGAGWSGPRVLVNGDVQATADKVNETGAITGGCCLGPEGPVCPSGSDLCAVYWSSVSASPLFLPAFGWSDGRDVNDNGIVVGESGGLIGPSQGFWWSPVTGAHGVLKPLKRQVAGTYNANMHYAVGESRSAGGLSRAVVWKLP